MRYATVITSLAAAYDASAYDSYGEATASSTAIGYSTSAAYSGHGKEYKSTSLPALSKPTPASSKIGYTTIYPGYGKEPVTVTSQYQAYPTCGAAGPDGKSCDKWEEDHYVSTVINDYDSKKVTVTYVEKPITVYHTKSTITHHPTASSSSGKAYPTGSYGYGGKKNATKPWYEMYEKVHEIKYKELGAHGLPGYGGSGMCKTCDDEQPYKVKEYKNGKWSEYETTAIYKAPVPETKTYEKPGVYTEPAKDITVSYTMTKPSEATTTAKAGVPVTYGGAYTDFKETGVKTCAYGAYETGKDSNGKDVTSTIVKTVTVTVSATGKYEIAKPTVTVYDHDTEVKYPTTTEYKPGVYHKDAQTVTITKSGDSYSCDYKQTKTYPAESTKTPAHGDEHSKPVDSKSSTEYKPKHPAPTPSISKPEDKYPATSSAPHYPEYTASSSVPSYDDKKSSSTPCSSSKPAEETVTKHLPPHGDHKFSTTEYPSYPASSSTPSHDDHKSYPAYPASSSAPSYDDHKSYPAYPASSSAPSYDDHKSYPAYPASSSTPSHDDHKSYPTYPASSSAPSYDDYKSSSVYHPEYPTTTVPHYADITSTPCPSSTKPVHGDEKSSSIYYPEYPASSSVPVHGEKSSSVYYPEYPAASSSAPAYGDEKSSSIYYPEYPASSSAPAYDPSYPVASSTPVYETYATPTPAEYTAASSSAPAYDPSYPVASSTPVYAEASSSIYPEYPASSSAPAYDPSYPVASSTPVYETYATPTPAEYTNSGFSYGDVPSATTDAYPSATPASSYDASKGYGYSKRASAVERRKAAIVKRANLI